MGIEHYFGWRAAQVSSRERRLRHRRKWTPTFERLEVRTLLSTIPVGLTIEGISFDQDASYNGGFAHIPADPSGAAGPNHVVSVVNTSIEWHRKDTGVQEQSQRLGANPSRETAGSFFQPLNPANNLFDPKVLFDQFAQRFVVVALEKVETSFAKSSRVLLAVSDDNDPNGVWRFHAINSLLNIGDAEVFADYPGLAVDSQAVYVTANMFSFGPSPSFGDSRLWIVAKGISTGGFYAGGPAAVSPYDPAQGTDSRRNFTVIPAQVYGTPPTSVGTWLAAYNRSSSDTAMDASFAEQVHVIQVENPLGAPTFIARDVSLGNIENASQELPDAPQLGNTTAVETNDRKALSAVWRGNSLYLTTTILPSTGADTGEATAHWVRINTTGSTAGNPVLLLADQGNIGGEDIATDTHTFYPSLAVNANNDVTIGFAASASTIYPGAYVTGRQATDAAGTVRVSRLMAPGLDDYVRKLGERNRWGDYSATAVDGGDDTAFWAFNEYALTGGLAGSSGDDGRWGTRWMRFSVAGGTGNLAVSAGDTPGSANVAGDGGADEFRIARNTTNATLLDVFINGSLFLSIPFADITAVTVNGSADADTLTVDYTNGGAVPAGGLVFNAGNGVDRLAVSGDMNFTALSDRVTAGVDTLSFTGTEEISLTGGAGNNTLNASGFGGPTTLDGGQPSRRCWRGHSTWWYWKRPIPRIRWK